MTRFSAIGICVVGILSSNLIACGDGESRSPTKGGVGGESGGAAGDTAGGATNAGAATGGASTAGKSGGGAGQGGSAGVGVGGMAGAGAAAAGAGGSTAGQAGQSGAGTSGSGGNGGATAGSPGAGGAAAGAGGSVAGSAGLGGGTSAGGVGAGGTTVIPIGACTASFILPANGETLTEADDVTEAFCANGFFFDVIVATDAPNGTAATLTVGNSTPVTATVQNAVARFPAAQLGTSGSQNLVVQIGASAGLLACSADESVTVNCLGHSTCNITAPTLTATHVALNGVAVAQGGDRVSSEGSPYQAAFQVATDIQDGQPVGLNVNNGTTTSTVYAVAMAGKAAFPGVTLTPDGSYTVTATCQARSGAQATSLPLTVPVDTAGPDLLVTKGTGSGAAVVSALADGDHFGPADDADPSAGLQLKICGATTAADALGLDAAAFGALANNFCVSTGGNTPLCAPALTSSGNGACVNFPCPGSGPFDLSVTLKDRAQNAVTTTRRNVTCAATNPVVQFQDPVSGGTGADPASFTNQALRILAASATGVGQKKDKTAATLGAQYDVVVCTSAPAGSAATLAQGWYGDAALTTVASTTVATDTGNLCSGTQPSVAVFSNVTINESTVKADYTLNKATELSVTITDLNFGVGTAVIDVWVDSVAPNLTLVTPATLCGSYINSATPSTQTLTFGTPVIPVTATVIPGSGTAVPYQSTQPLSIFSQVAISGVAFPVGTNLLTATAVKPSGNSASFPATGTCQVTVGSTPPPIVTWSASPAGSSPVATSLLTAPGNTTVGAIADADPATAGWQGTLRACANLTGAGAAGVTMQFAVNGADVGIAQNLNQSDGCASLAVTGANEVPNGGSVQLSARTSTTPNGVGIGSINVPVDVTSPSTPENLKAITKSRRQTSFTLSWNLPAAGSIATDYEVRVSKAIIDSAAKFSAAEAVAFDGTPQVLGQNDTIDIVNRFIENDYYFAVQSVDSVGNRSSIAYTSTPTVEHFLQMEIPSPTTGNNFGWTVDGTADLNGDIYADLVVGSVNGSSVYLYFGSASGYTTSPSVVIQGTAAYFGSALSVVGDLNKDGRNDIVIGSPREGDGVVYIYYGRASWPPVLTSANANVVVSGDSTVDPKYTTSQFGQSIARLGDFNNDGVDDFAIGVSNYNALPARHQGQVVILYGKSGGHSSTVRLPGAFGVSATRIDGDVSTAGRLGYMLSGLGYFYGSTGGTGLVASAPYTATASGATSGRLYSFSSRTGTPASIAVTAASHTLDGSVASGAIGFYGIPTLGDLGPGGQPAFGVPILLTSESYLQVRSGTVAEGPFGQAETITTTEPSTTRAFARYVGSSGISGTMTSMSTVGGSRSDLVVSTQANGSRRLFIIDGTRMVYGGTATVEALANVTVQVMAPSAGTWNEFARGLTLIRDADGDGFSDIVVGDVSYGSVVPNGRVVILR